MTEDKPTISKDDKIGEVVRKYPETIQVFLKHGLHCVGCGAAFFESIEQGATAHSIHLQELLKDLNNAVKNNKQEKE